MKKHPKPLAVAGYYKNLAKIGSYVDRFSSAANLDDQTAYAVHMAVDEACANIIKHAYGGEGRGSIRIACQIQPDGLEFTIYDQGNAIFDVTKVPMLDTAAPLEKRKPGGMGVFFIYRLMDRVEYHPATAQGNRLTLFKRRKSSQ